MADFAEWGVAAEGGLGLPDGAFLSAYTRNREGANLSAIEASPVGQPLVAFVEDQGVWEGTATELLNSLESDDYSDEKTRRLRGWPRSPRGMGGALRRLAPNLRSYGINVAVDERKGGAKRDRIIQLEKRTAEPSLSSQPSQTPENRDGGAGRSGDGRNDSGAVEEEDRPSPSSQQTDLWDDRDGRDGVAANTSYADQETERVVL